ncbi:MAG: RHS repeat-associated core domain-containing protein, partial [Candidatus Riflebacteria bacterium]|nr:RHS repeat-associated core domain-containing protein [Candidatus Riflebacteria bacterium]
TGARIRDPEGVDQLRGHGDAGSIESGPRTGTPSRSRAAPPFVGPMRAWCSLLFLLLVGAALLVGLADPARALPIQEPVQWRDTDADGRSGAQASLYQLLRNRWYHPDTGRLLSRDPIGFAGGINLYGYVESSPVGRRDPLGLQYRQPTPSDVWNSIIGAPRKARDIANQVLDAPLRDVNMVIEEGDEKARKGVRDVAEKMLEETLAPAPLESAVPVPAPPPTGQRHHPISKKVHEALQESEYLRDKYMPRDPAYVTRAKDAAAHKGYDAFHRMVDKEVVKAIRSHPEWRKEQFDDFLEQLYKTPPYSERFPEGCGRKQSPSN